MSTSNHNKALVHVIVFALLACACSSTPRSESYRRVDETSMRNWVWLGGDPVKIETAIGNMKATIRSRRNPEQFDTVSEYGPGHWVFEFETLGDAAVSEGVVLEEAGEHEGSREAFLEAAAYYQIGKWVHPDQKKEMVSTVFV